MKRCCNKIRSELLNTTVKFTVEILSSTFVWLDLSTEVIRSMIFNNLCMFYYSIDNFPNGRYNIN